MLYQYYLQFTAIGVSYCVGLMWWGSSVFAYAFLGFQIRFLFIFARPTTAPLCICHSQPCTVPFRCNHIAGNRLAHVHFLPAGSSQSIYSCPGTVYVCCCSAQWFLALARFMLALFCLTAESGTREQQPLNTGTSKRPHSLVLLMSFHNLFLQHGAGDG